MITTGVVMTESPPMPGIEYGRTDRAQPTLHDVAVVATKVLGLYTFVEAIRYSPFIAVLLVTPKPPTSFQLATLVLPGTIYVTCGLTLLLGTRWVVARVMRVAPPEIGSCLSPPGRTLQVIAFWILGIGLTTWGLVEIARQSGVAMDTLRSRMAPILTTAHVMEMFAPPVIKLSIGIFLIGRARAAAAS
jgi:hypothetical protein